MKKTLEQIKLLNNKMISYNEFLYICSCGLVRFCERVYMLLKTKSILLKKILKIWINLFECYKKT